MRLLLAISLVLSMSGADIERALALARARDSERQQFHSRYVINLSDPVVTQIEVVTEFRRLVIIAEEHVLRGDWMFTRSVRAAEDVLKPSSGVITLKAQVRFNPMNSFIASPPYVMALGSGADGPLQPVITDLTPQFSVPFRTQDGKTVSSLIGATLTASVAAGAMGQSTKTIGVTLDGRDIAHATVDFARLD